MTCPAISFMTADANLRVEWTDITCMKKIRTILIFVCIDFVRVNLWQMIYSMKYKFAIQISEIFQIL
jgi:hypothetical protein